jgi:hypothetical protein
MISISIDVTKIDKQYLISGKNGAKYLDVLILDRKNGRDQYGNDFVVTQGLCKAERDRGRQGPILGNGRVIESRPKPSNNPRYQEDAPPESKDDDIPF